MSSLEEKLRHLSGTLRAAQPATAPPSRAAGGRCVERRSRVDADTLCGGMAAYASAETLEMVGRVPLADFSLEKTVFLDTETTGLSGGVGTVAFLIGIGFLQEDSFVVEQYFMEDYDAETDMLHRLCRRLANFDTLVSYNGKGFDVPIVNSRSIVNRIRQPIASMRHIDLLYAARRLWKARLGSCGLQNVEREILGFAREDDIPGSMVPMIFFDFLKDGDMTRMEGVLEHNRMDIQSLYTVLCRLCRDVALPLEQPEPADRYSAGRILEAAGRSADALRCYEAAGEPYGPALRARALLLRRSGRADEAAYCWKRLLEQGMFGAEPYEELAKYYEHTRRDDALALKTVEECLLKLRLLGLEPLDSLVKRRVRLTQRMKQGRTM
ncbi:MAG: ribonuclease H-like domain-containing protein [Eubacteriales bacterium]|nr:ribonuclease H-like domain-containing protein [Eubacteriales bacterium]